MRRKRRVTQLLVLCVAWAVSCGGVGNPDLTAGAAAPDLPGADAATGQTAAAPVRVFERKIGSDTFEIAIRSDTAAADAAAEEALAEAERLAQLLLAEVPASEIDVLNRVPSHLFIQLSPATLTALARALAIAEESGGAYDPTTPPLLDLWGVRTGAVKAPRQFEIDIALRKVDWLEIELGEDGKSARRLNRRTQIDLGPVAQGAVVDGALAVLREAGLPSARVRWGSAAAAFGGTRDVPWSVSVAPVASDPVATLELTEGAAGVIVPQRLFEGPSGELLHEWMDGRTGRPAVAARLAAVTAPDAATAAGYALAVFVLGNEAPEWVDAREGVEALLELSSGDRWASAGARVRWAQPSPPAPTP